MSGVWIVVVLPAAVVRVPVVQSQKDVPTANSVEAVMVLAPPSFSVPVPPEPPLPT